MHIFASINKMIKKKGKKEIVGECWIIFFFFFFFLYKLR